MIRSANTELMAYWRDLHNRKQLAQEIEACKRAIGDTNTFELHYHKALDILFPPKQLQLFQQ